MIEVIVGEIAGALAFSIYSITWGALHYADRMHKREMQPEEEKIYTPVPISASKPNVMLLALQAEQKILLDNIDNGESTLTERAKYLARLREVVQEIEVEEKKEKFIPFPLPHDHMTAY